MAKGRLFIGLRKNVFSLLLNILGLTVAFTAFMIIMVQVNYDLGYDKSYGTADRLFRVEYTSPNAGGEYSPAFSRPISIRFGDSSPDIVAVANWRWGSNAEFKSTENSDDSYIMTQWFWISPESLELFDFNITAGDPESFANPGHALIPESLAAKFFPEGNGAGQLISIRGDETQYPVAAVYKDFPSNSTVKNIIYFTLGNAQINDDSEWNLRLYVLINDPANKDKVQASMNEVMHERMNEGYGLAGDEELIRLSSLHDVYYAKDIQFDGSEKGNKSTTISLLTIAIFIIFIAIINFINFALASIPSKIKTINVQKILGSTDGHLRRVQIMESVLLALLSFGLALLTFNALKSSALAGYLSADMALNANWPIIIMAGICAVFTGILAGVYPAFYSTSYQPALVLKGSFSLSPGGRRLRSFLIGFQFTISLVLMITALYIKVQSDYMKKFDMGFRTENIVNYWISYATAQQKEAYMNRLKESPYITDVTFADGDLVSNGKMGWGRFYKGERVDLNILPVDPNFIEFFDLEIVDGRGFRDDDALKESGMIVFNQAAVEKYGFEIGSGINGHNNEIPAEIIGTVKDFNFQPLQYGISPLGLYLFGSKPWRLQQYAYVKIAPGGIPQALEHIKAINIEFDPTQAETTFNFMDEGINNLYAKEDALASLILIFCYLSVFISIMGILGLIFFETRFRRKEIALRRVMGSTIPELLVMLNTIYVKITLIAFVVAAPAAWLICRTWVKSFEYQAHIPAWIFIASLLAVLIINIVIISARSYKSVTANPVDSISSE